MYEKTLKIKRNVDSYIEVWGSSFLYELYRNGAHNICNLLTIWNSTIHNLCKYSDVRSIFIETYKIYVMYI